MHSDVTVSSVEDEFHKDARFIGSFFESPVYLTEKFE